MNALTRTLNTIWTVLGSAPLWIKIMGIVVLPLFLVVLFLTVELREAMLVLEAHPEEPSFAPGLISLFIQGNLLLLALVLVVGIGLAYGLSQVLARPLRRLLDAIRQVEAGNLQARVPVWADDEVGQVQQAFNRMVQKLDTTQRSLEERNRELSLANQIAMGVAEGLGVDAILENTLTDALALTGSDWGSVYLYDPAREGFNLRLLLGPLSPALARASTYREARTSPMRRVVETGAPYSMDDISTAPEYPEEIRDQVTQQGMRAWVCAPLKTKGQVVGVLNLLRRRAEPYTARDMEMLETVGGFLGVALANASLLEDLHHKEAELRRALRRAVEVQEEERKRLSRELHDEVGQALTSTLIRLRALQGEQDLETVHQRLEGMRYLTVQSIEELRRLAMDLRPAALDSLGIVPALRWYIQQVGERSGIQVGFVAPEQMSRLPAEVELALYRIAQEGLTNALRHSRAQRVDVLLELGPHAVWLTISDDGLGFDQAAADSGLGLVGMRERIDLFGGAYRIETAPGQGTRLWVEIPLNERGQPHAE
jgi:signal transduction histidine kinase